MLNATYEPLSVVPSRRAACLVLADKADIIEDDGTHLHCGDAQGAQPGRDPPALRREGAVPPPHGDVAPCRVRPRRAQLPVLRADRRLDRPHHAALARRRAHLGERRRGVPAVQPAQARPHARRGRHAAGPPGPRPEGAGLDHACRSTASPRPGSRTSPSPADECRPGTSKHLAGDAAAFHARPLRRASARPRSSRRRRRRWCSARRSEPSRSTGSRRRGRASTSSADDRVGAACCCGPASTCGSTSRSRRRPACGATMSAERCGGWASSGSAALAPTVEPMHTCTAVGCSAPHGPTTSASRASGPGEVMVGEAKLVGISQRRTRDAARFQTMVHLRWRPDTVAGVDRRDPLRTPTGADLHAVAATCPHPASSIITSLDGRLAERVARAVAERRRCRWRTATGRVATSALKSMAPALPTPLSALPDRS